jgi:hypothetical protein
MEVGLKVLCHDTTAKAAFNKKTLFTSNLDLEFEEEPTKMLPLEHGFVCC